MSTKHIESDPALERRFVKVQVDEPNEELCLQILTGMAHVYAAHHQIKVTKDGIAAAVQLSQSDYPQKITGKSHRLIGLEYVDVNGATVTPPSTVKRCLKSARTSQKSPTNDSPSTMPLASSIWNNI